MFQDLKSYPDYLSSNVAWAPELPAHWSVRRPKTLFARMSRPVGPDDGVVTCFRDGVVTLRSKRRTAGFTEALQEIGYQGIRTGDLVIHAMDAFAGAVGVSDSDGKGTPVYAVCRPRGDENPHYFAALVREMARTQWIAALSRGVRERSTDFRFETFANLDVPVPPADEQTTIVKYLAHAHARLDRAIAAKRKLISLLEEQKRAISNQAVTRGLDPTVPMKDSGVPWIGRMPSHWELRRAKELCARIVDCKNRTPRFVDDGEYHVVRTTCIRRGAFSLEGSYTTDELDFSTWTERGAPQAGDVFFTREAPTGEAALVPDRADLCMGQRMMYLRPAPALLDPRFLLHSIYGPVVRAYIDVSRNGSTVGHLRLGQVGSMPILWCPIEEQRAIVDHIRRETSGMDAACQTAAAEIGLLREYRSRLTSDVVTGQLDVRAIAARLPDSVESLAIDADGYEEEPYAELDDVLEEVDV